MKTLTEEEFDTQFTPVPAADGDAVRPSDDGLDKASTKLWTIVDGDDGGLYAVSGWHLVNRVGYLLTEEDWTEPTEAVWFAAGEDEEDEESDNDD
jgi:hypothetical protein